MHSGPADLAIDLVNTNEAAARPGRHRGHAAVASASSCARSSRRVAAPCCPREAVELLAQRRAATRGWARGGGGLRRRRDGPRTADGRGFRVEAHARHAHRDTGTLGRCRPEQDDLKQQRGPPCWPQLIGVYVHPESGGDAQKVEVALPMGLRGRPINTGASLPPGTDGPCEDQRRRVAGEARPGRPRRSSRRPSCQARDPARRGSASQLAQARTAHMRARRTHPHPRASARPRGSRRAARRRTRSTPARGPDDDGSDDPPGPGEGLRS